jgi:hypothetical protein
MNLSQNKEKNVEDTVKKMICEVRVRAPGKAFPQDAGQLQYERPMDDS